MLAEFRSKSQITIPRELVDKLGLKKGDKLEVFERDGLICIMPVVVYPQKYLEALREEINEAKGKIATGDQPVFGSVDALFEKLERN